MGLPMSLVGVSLVGVSLVGIMKSRCKCSNRGFSHFYIKSELLKPNEEITEIIMALK
jgi:hypothetical protein